MVAAGEAKIVTLKKGKVVDEEPVEVVARPAQAQQLGRKFSGMLKGMRGKQDGDDGK